MSAYECLTAHRSIRKYQSTPIPQGDVQSILHAATRASSSGNMQTYSIIVTRDADRRQRLWELHYRQPMILQAPMLLTFCADWRRMNRWCEISDAEPGYDNFLSFLVGFADAMIAAQNAALASESLGYGICYMGTTLCATSGLIELFELPHNVFPATTLVVGTPDEQPQPRARLPMDGIVHHETYGDPDDESVRQTYDARETEGWQRYMQFPEIARKMTESGVKNLAQVYTKLKYTRQANEAISRELLANLKQQGFLDGDQPD